MRSMETARPGYSHTFGIPAVRVGWLIARARSKANLDEKSLAVAVDVRKRLLRRWERGEQIPGDDAVEAIAAACGIDVATLLPVRDVVELDRASRFLRVGSSLVSVAELHNDAILHAYVELVRDQRGVLPGRPFKIRDEDLDVLATSLDLDDDELVQRLVKIIGLSPTDAGDLRGQIVRRRLAMPAAGLLMSGVGLFGAHLAGASSNAPARVPSATVAVVTSVNQATTVDTSIRSSASDLVTGSSSAPEGSPILTALTGMDVVVPANSAATTDAAPPPAADVLPASEGSAATASTAPQANLSTATTMEAPAASRAPSPPSTAAGVPVAVMIDAGATSITNPGR